MLANITCQLYYTSFIYKRSTWEIEQIIPAISAFFSSLIIKS